MSSGLPSDNRDLKRDAAKSNIPEAVSEAVADESTLASNGLGIFPFRDVAPGLENPGKQQSAR